LCTITVLQTTNCFVRTVETFSLSAYSYNVVNAYRVQALVFGYAYYSPSKNEGQEFGLKVIISIR